MVIRTILRRFSTCFDFGPLRVVLVCLAVSFGGCADPEAPASITAADDPTEVVFADTIFHNGLVYTVNATNDIVESIAIKDGLIIALGSDDEIAPLAGETTRVIDLNGRMLMPGIVDAHMHPTNAGPELVDCTLRQLESNTVEAALARMTACLTAEGEVPDDRWLQVRGWRGIPLSAVVLDRLSTDRPVLVQESSYHAVVGNTRAMQLAGITRDTPDPVDGRVDRDDRGEPTGIFYDGAQGYIRRAVPPLSEAEQRERNLAYLEIVLEALAEEGVTTVFDAAAGQGGMEALLQKHNEGQLTVRAQLAPVISAEAAADPAQVIARIQDLGRRFNTPRRAQTPGLRVETAKLFLDGVPSARTAALVEPYRTNAGTAEQPRWEASDDYGPTYFEPAVVAVLLDQLAANGINAHIHAIGDRAVDDALTAIAGVREKHPEKDFRPALAHAVLVQPADYRRFVDLDVTPVLSFQWSQPSRGGSSQDLLGEERSRRLHATGTFHEAGVRVAFGSDWPIDPLNEWLAMQIGITRTNPAAPELGRLGDDPGIDFATAVRAMTLNAAYTLNMDQYVGSLEVGKFADLIVVDQDLTSIAPERISNTRVLLTMVGGHEVYRAAISL